MPDFFDHAEHVLADVNSPDDDVERVINDIIGLDVSSATDSLAASQIDHVAIERVIAVLRARRAAVAVELADIGRQRADLARRHRGVVGYTRSGS